MKHTLIDLTRVATRWTIDSDEVIDVEPASVYTDDPKPMLGVSPEFLMTAEVRDGNGEHWVLHFNPNQFVELVAGTAVVPMHSYGNDVQVGVHFEIARSVDDYDILTHGMAKHKPGAPCPVHPDTVVEILTRREKWVRDVTPIPCTARGVNWGLTPGNPGGEVVAWRPCKVQS